MDGQREQRMNITYRINGIEASPAEQVAFRVGYKTARDEYEPMIRELNLDIESLREQLRELYRVHFKQDRDFDELLKENERLRENHEDRHDPD
jgi:hypothetical protein